MERANENARKMQAPYREKSQHKFQSLIAAKGAGLDCELRRHILCLKIFRHLVTHAEAGTIGEHACGNVHGEELLEEEFRGIRDVDLRDASLIVAGAALIETLLELTIMMISICFQKE